MISSIVRRQPIHTDFASTIQIPMHGEAIGMIEIDGNDGDNGCCFKNASDLKRSHSIVCGEVDKPQQYRRGRESIDCLVQAPQ